MPRARTSKKRAQIVATATELFRRFGIRRVTVTEICAEASVSKVTFYKYFANKTELARFVIDEWSDRIVARVDELSSLDVPFAEKAQRFIDERIAVARELSPEFFAELYDGDEALRPFLRERSATNLRHFVEFIASAQRRGEVRDDVKPELALLIVERLNDLARDEQVRALYPDHVELTRLVNDLFFFGLLPRDSQESTRRE